MAKSKKRWVRGIFLSAAAVRFCGRGALRIEAFHFIVLEIQKVAAGGSIPGRRYHFQCIAHHML